MGNVHANSIGFEIVESVRFSERVEEELSELPDEFRSLSEKLPALSTDVLK